MKNFTCVQDIGNLKTALDEAFEIKKDRFKYVELGRNKTLMMIFFNSSLRTRLSTQKAALNLGMNVLEVICVKRTLYRSAGCDILKGRRFDRSVNRFEFTETRRSALLYNFEFCHFPSP